MIGYRLVSLLSVLLLFSLLPIIPTTESQAPELPDEDDKTYYGIEYGTAGIVKSLIEIYQLNILDTTSQSELLESIEQSLHTIWENRLDYDGMQYPAWPRSTDEIDPNSIYPGKKYGTSGIIGIFLEMYDLTQNSTWLEKAEESYWFLSTQAINETTTPHWPYHFVMPKENVGISITDLKYGSVGILENSLDLYEITGNNSYLDHGAKIVQWLVQISSQRQVNGKKYTIIPWYFSDHYTENDKENIPYYLTYGYGLAGIGPVLYRFGNITNNDNYKNWALEMGEFIQSSQFEDGSWFSSDDEPMVRRIGYDNGVVGIINGLSELDLLSNNTLFSTAITKGVEWLFNMYISNSSHYGFYPSYDANSNTVDRKLINSLYDGNLGVLSILLKLYHELTQDQQAKILDLIRWIFTAGSFSINSGSHHLTFLFETTSNHNYIEFSYANGLSGYLSYLISLIKMEDISTLINLNITNVIERVYDGLNYFRNSEGMWKRQYAIPNAWNIEYQTISDFTVELTPTSTDPFSNPFTKSFDSSKSNWLIVSSMIIIMSLGTLIRRKR